MAFFKKERHTDETGKKWNIFSPTTKKMGTNIVNIKGRDSEKVFVKRRRK